MVPFLVCLPEFFLSVCRPGLSPAPQVLPSPNTFPDTEQAVSSPLLSEQATHSVASDAADSLGSLWLVFWAELCSGTDHSLTSWLSSHAHLRSERPMLRAG